MIELNRKVFGKITAKEIIGSFPPAIPDTKRLLENEFQNLIIELKARSEDDLKKLLSEQQMTNKYINSRPGAMALAQDKIRLFNEYNQKYIMIINKKLDL